MSLPTVGMIMGAIQDNHLDSSVDEYHLAIFYTAQGKAGEGPIAISDEGLVAPCLGFDILGPISDDDVGNTEMQVVNLIDEHHAGGYNIRKIHGRIGDKLYVNPTIESLRQDLEGRRGQSLGERLDEALSL